jgi:hypothetical protein
MRTLVTIDWDYFIPEHLDWDFGHRESLIFLQNLWIARGRYFREMRTTGQERGFWDRLKSRLGKTLFQQMEVSDSHVDVYTTPALAFAEKVVIIDRHHDIFNKPKDHVDCGNWLADWLEGDSKRRAVWVKPGDEHVYSGDPIEPYRKRVKILTYIPDLRKDVIIGMHVCRSGCWTPPWLDAAFIRFVKESGYDIEKLHLEWCDPLQPRFTLDDFRQMFNHTKEIDMAMKLLNKDKFAI